MSSREICADFSQAHTPALHGHLPRSFRFRNRSNGVDRHHPSGHEFMTLCVMLEFTEKVILNYSGTYNACLKLCIRSA
jgi:hypothetical protein